MLGIRSSEGKVTLPVECTVVWGDPRDQRGFTAYTSMLTSDQIVYGDGGQPFAELEMGPVPVAGPIIHQTMSDAGHLQVMVLVDVLAPSWVTAGTPVDWGWQPVDELPKPSRYPFPVDVLLLASNWAGSFDGWSSSQWCDADMKAMQRTTVPVSPGSADQIQVRVLETGVDGHGVGYAVVFTPDRPVVDAADLDRHGWRREPWVRVRRQSWSDLADLAEAIEALTVPVFGSSVVSEVTIHDVTAVNADVLYLLPEDVRDALTDALAADPTNEGLTPEG